MDDSGLFPSFCHLGQKAVAHGAVFVDSGRAIPVIPHRGGLDEGASETHLLQGLAKKRGALGPTFHDGQFVGACPALSNICPGEMDHDIHIFKCCRRKDALLEVPRISSCIRVGARITSSKGPDGRAFLEERMGQCRANHSRGASDQPSLGFHSYLMLTIEFTHAAFL